MATVPSRNPSQRKVVCIKIDEGIFFFYSLLLSYPEKMPPDALSPEVKYSIRNNMMKKEKRRGVGEDDEEGR